jgi:hypothetical protein
MCIVVIFAAKRMEVCRLGKGEDGLLGILHFTVLYRLKEIIKSGIK